MANPQLEKGFVRIANEIIEALARIRIPGEARQVIDVVIRKTYGFNKKQDRIALSQFSIATGLSKQDVARALRKAKELNIVKVIGENAYDIGKEYRFNKDFDTWKPLAKKPTSQKSLAKTPINVGNNAYNRRRKCVPQKTLTKDRKTANVSIWEKVEEIRKAKTFPISNK